MSTVVQQTAGSDRTAVYPFHVDVPEAELAELRRRIRATRWPERETVTDESQGVKLTMMQNLARYWETDYDWRKVEATLNAIPQFITNIDGLDIQFIHVRSKHQTALPLIVTHGWPYSIISLLKIIERLTNPTARGASASDAFHLVIPSLPGYGFSGKPVTTGWGPDRIASAWAAGVSQTDPLQQGYERRALCGLGAAKNPFRRGSRGLKIAACIAEHEMFATPSAFAGLLYKGDIV